MDKCIENERKSTLKIEIALSHRIFLSLLLFVLYRTKSPYYTSLSSEEEEE